MFASSSRRGVKKMLRLLAVAAPAALASAVFAPAQARADERPFAFVYDVTTTAQGKWEYEQWVTWKTIKDSDSKYDKVEFRHEFEYGVTDNLQLGIYVADWRYEDGRSVDSDGFKYTNSAIEAIYRLTDPIKDILGLGLYLEYKGGPEMHALEGKILVQKNIDRWVFAYNASIENEWEEEDHHWEKIGEFQQTAGVSYQFSPRLSAGVEALFEVEFPEWEQQEDYSVYVGPNISYRSEKWWITVAPLFQTTSNEGEANIMTRVLLGINF